MLASSNPNSFHFLACQIAFSARVALLPNNAKSFGIVSDVGYFSLFDKSGITFLEMLQKSFNNCLPKSVVVVFLKFSRDCGRKYYSKLVRTRLHGFNVAIYDTLRD